MPLPSGVVTFVFTDIEGSTRLLNRLGDRYGPLLERHRELLRKAWRDCGGHVVDAEGDSFLVVFERATAAVQACAAAQRLLGAEPWPEQARVRVRMGVHNGLASPRDGRYVAMAVHRAARVMGAAHGGQVLLTEDVKGAIELASDLRLASLGRFRLRDFDEPVRLFQLVGSGLAADFPAVRAVPAEGHNLVVPPTTFVGREWEVARVGELLDVQPLVTLVGPGGVGKTRLAIEVGVTIAPRWPDGVWFVDLANLEDAALVPRAIAAAVGVPPGVAVDRWSEVVEHLENQEVVIVLDNVERHVGVCGELVMTLLAACPDVGVLSTSRERLNVAGEVVVRVEPLRVPAADAADGGAVRSPAVQLFIERARGARPDLVEDDDTLAEVAAICRRLDGLPLALEIVAARVGGMSLADIRHGLESGFQLLRSRDPTLPERQRTMDTLLAWSERWLTVDERAALRRLAVFGGGFSVDAARVAVADEHVDAADVPDLVLSLVDKSLVVADLTANATRYRYLETVRDYARGQLAAAGETMSVATRLAAWFLERLGPWRTPDGAWTSEVGVERANLRALVSLMSPTDPEQAQQLACVISRYYEVIQRWLPAIEDFERYLVELPAPTPARVALLTWLGQVYLRVGRIEPAIAVVDEAAALRDLVGPAPWDDTGVERTRGELALRTGDLATAMDIAEQTLSRELSPYGQARMWNLMGIARIQSDDLVGATKAFDEELAALVVVGHEAFVAMAHGNCAEVAMRRGDIRSAASHQLACLELALALGQPLLVASSVILAARLAGVAGTFDVAARLHAYADGALEEIGWVMYEHDRQLSDQLLVNAREHLGEAMFADELVTGRALDTDKAAALAADVLKAAISAAPPTVACDDASRLR